MNDGTLEVIVGPMFAEKTSELMRRINRAEIAGLKWIIIKPDIDNRYTTNAEIVAHDGKKKSAMVVKSLSLLDRSAFDNFDVIAIDEAQFFVQDSELYDFCDDMMDKNKRVIVDGLSGNFERKTIGKIHEIYPLATGGKVEFLTAICVFCHAEAPYSLKLDKKMPEGASFDIGGAEKYKPVCRKCFKKYS